MPETLKSLYDEPFMDRLANSLIAINIEIDKENFISSIFFSDWQYLELKDRMKHISFVVNQHLFSSYYKKVNQLIQLTDELSNSKSNSDGFLCGFIPQIIESNGLNYFDESAKAFEKITPFTTCEFAVRPFIEKYKEKMFGVIQNWSNSPNHHVRRLASEGCRPLLPWGNVLQGLKKDPTPIFPILENLKNDSSEYVRRSVANNLNDISKSQPNLVINLLTKWKNEPEETQSLLKHACRTLLKSGNQEVLGYFGWFYDKNLEVENLEINRETTIDNPLYFSFTLINKDLKERKIRIEYSIYFLKQNGKHNQKVFQVSNANMSPNSNKKYIRIFSFKPISTRTYHKGKHFFSLIINGRELEKKPFEFN